MPSELAKIGSGVARQNRPTADGTVQPPPGPSPRREAENSLEKLWNGKAISPKIWTLVWLALGTTALILIALIAGFVLRLERQSFANLQRTNVVMGALDVLANTEYAENRQRGYLLTGDTRYIETYERSREDLDNEFDRLRQLVRNNQKEREQVEKLRSLVQQNLDELQSVIDVRTRAGAVAARALAQTGRGPQIMDAIRRHVSGMEGDEESKLAQFSRERGSRLRVSLAALVGSVFLAACGLTERPNCARS